MSQQINLLRAAPRKSASAFTFAHALPLAALTTAALATIIAVYENRQLDAVQAQAQAVERKLKDARLAHESVLAQRKGRKAPAVTDPALADLDAQLKSREEIGDALKNGIVGTTGGFSEYMLALSRQSLAGVWLTGFEFAAGGSELTLAGRALSADLVPSYLQQLTQAPPLQGRRFASMLISQPPANAAGKDPAEEAGGQAGQRGPPYVEFRISSAHPDTLRGMAITPPRPPAPAKPASNVSSAAPQPKAEPPK